MKKYAKLATLLVSVLLITAGSTMAMPFSSSGFVNPNFNNSWNAADLTGTARFKFTIDEDWPQVTSVYIEFENDIFNLDELGVSDFTVQNPGGWSTSIFASSIGYAFSVSSPSTAGAIATAANDPIIIDVAFTLRDAAMFNQAEEEIPDGGGWAWDEGQAWGLAYTLRGPICLNDCLIPDMDVSSGSTAPVPEPATMLLLGTGLIGIFRLGRKRMKLHT